MKKIRFVLIIVTFYIIAQTNIYSIDYQFTINIAANQTYFQFNTPILDYEISYMGLGLNYSSYLGDTWGWFLESSVIYDLLMLRNHNFGNRDFNLLSTLIIPIDFDLLTGIAYRFNFSKIGIILGAGIHINFLYLYDSEYSSQSISYAQLGFGGNSSFYIKGKKGFIYRIGLDLSYDPFAFATNIPGFDSDFAGGFSLLIFTGFGYSG